MDRAQVAAEVGRRLRALRTERGLSLSELARQAGLGKGTLSELETGQRNPTLDTLFAVTSALRLPLSAALPAGRQAPPDASGDAVDAWLVDQQQGADVYRLRIEPGRVQHSDPHAPGVREQVLVVHGRLRLADGDTILDAGEMLDYAGDLPHVWEALEPVSAVLVMRYP
jgi:transcriptional regulator with XRE-family HTH domain